MFQRPLDTPNVNHASHAEKRNRSPVKFGYPSVAFSIIIIDEQSIAAATTAVWRSFALLAASHVRISRQPRDATAINRMQYSNESPVR